MKILTVLGTRPEIIRLSEIVRILDRCAIHTLVHTGQNYDPALSDIFLNELGVRKPDHILGVKGRNFADQAGQILQRVDDLLVSKRPDRVLILGDTNSGLAAIVAARRRIPVYHLEAGNRCYDSRVPEEVNRRIIDHCSDILMPYTNRSAENLVAEGIRREQIFIVGNPIGEVIAKHKTKIERSEVLTKLNLRRRGFILATMHRAENVDTANRLKRHCEALVSLAKNFKKPVIMSVHPRTADKMKKARLEMPPSLIRLQPPFGFFDFIKLEKSAYAIVTDSGTVQEEACLFGIPSVTIRDVTERPETTECGSNILVADDRELTNAGMRLAVELGTRWTPPLEYSKPNVANTVAKIMLSYRCSR